MGRGRGRRQHGPCNDGGAADGLSSVTALMDSRLDDSLDASSVYDRGSTGGSRVSHCGWLADRDVYGRLGDVESGTRWRRGVCQCMKSGRVLWNRDLLFASLATGWMKDWILRSLREKKTMSELSF